MHVLSKTTFDCLYFRKYANILHSYGSKLSILHRWISIIIRSPWTTDIKWLEKPWTSQSQLFPTDSSNYYKSVNPTTILWIPGPLLQSWIVLAKPKLPTNKKYNETSSSSLGKPREGKPARRERRETFHTLRTRNFTQRNKRFFTKTLNYVPNEK